MENLAFWNVDFEVDGLNCVSDTERSERENSAAIGNQIDWNIDESCASVRNTVVESFDNGVCWTISIDGLCSNEWTVFLPATVGDSGGLKLAGMGDGA